MNHTQLLNHLAAKYNLKSYLEIGVQATVQNFDKINCHYKIGVDPCFNELLAGFDTKKRFFNLKPYTSDNFFSAQKDTFDLIFLDGLHHADQVQRDFENSLKCLNDGGFIVLHDTCPTEEQYTTVPRLTKIWFGDVYKFAMKLGLLPGINFVTLDVDCGITIVWKASKVTGSNMSEATWEDYKAFKALALRIIQPSDLDKYLPKVKEAVT